MRWRPNNFREMTHRIVVLCHEQGAAPCLSASRRLELTSTSTSSRTRARAAATCSVIKALGRRDEVEASGLFDGLIASAFPPLDRVVELLSRPVARAAAPQHRSGFGVRPALGGDRMPRRAREPRCRPALFLR